MKKLLIILFISLINIINSQDEKHLALVIGNANYDKGALKNPVNDAELFARTLDSLNFDVIVKTNLESRSEFIRAIREFGQIRAEYDVAFVYYAGHGIQVDNENFLLPTKEEFLSEDDVLDFGVSVQNVLRYLESESEKVNILILDACRDNPFEVKWNATRSLKGNGLAKIPPPTGSLIAFSTDAGSTAADGESENSVYCKSLCKNFLLEDVSIDQVFRNVRSDVLNITNKRQRPVESSQLTGNTFYVNPKSMIDDIIIVNELYNNFKYKEAFSELEKRFKNFTASPKLIELHINLLLKLKMEEEALTLLDSYLENNDFLELKSFLAYKVNAELKNFEVARKHIEKALYFDSLNSKYLSKQSYLFYNHLEEDQAKKNINLNISKIKLFNSQNGNVTNSFYLAYHYYLLDDVSSFMFNVNEAIKENITSHEFQDLIKYSEDYIFNFKLLKDFNINQKDYIIFFNNLCQYAYDIYPKNYLFALESSDFETDASSSYKIKDINLSLSLYPNNRIALYERAMYYYNLSNDCFDKDGEFEEIEFNELKCKDLAYKAISDFNYLKENYSDEKTILQSLGLTYQYLLKDYNKSVQFFNEYIGDSKNLYWKNYQWLGNAHRELEDISEALDNYNLAIISLKNQKKFYNDKEYKFLLSDIHVRIAYALKYSGDFDTAYYHLKESFNFNPNKRQYDVIESAIFNNDLEYAIRTSNEVYETTKDSSFKILKAIAHVKKGNIEKGDSIFLNYIKSPNIAYLVNKKARIKKVFFYCSQFYFLRNNYEKAIDYIIKWNEWLSEKSDKLNPSNFYLLAYSYFNNQNYIEAYVSIEKAIIGLPNLSLFQLDETFYIPLSEEKIYELKKKIISKLNNK